MYDIHEKARKESRIFNLGDFMIALLVAIPFAWVGVDALVKLGFVESALIQSETWDMTLDLRGVATLVLRVGVFIVSFLGTLMFSADHRTKK